MLESDSTLPVTFSTTLSVFVIFGMKTLVDQSVLFGCQSVVRHRAFHSTALIYRRHIVIFLRCIHQTCGISGRPDTSLSLCVALLPCFRSP